MTGPLDLETGGDDERCDPIVVEDRNPASRPPDARELPAYGRERWR